jgi:hypothetical protein
MDLYGYGHSANQRRFLMQPEAMNRMCDEPNVLNWIIGGRVLVEFVQLPYIPLLRDSSGIFKSNGISDRFYEE